MAATTGFRTLYPAIVPPGSAHIDGVITAGAIQALPHVVGGAVASSLLIDYFFRSSGKANIHHSDFLNLPLGEEDPLWPTLAQIYLRLNCLTEAYKSLWESITDESWTVDTPLRNAWERQLAQIEIDVLVALSLGVTVDELCLIYRTQFPVMRRYDKEGLFDATGRRVPKEVVKLYQKRTSTNEVANTLIEWEHPQSMQVYEFRTPFRGMDREEQFRIAYERITQGSSYSR